MWSDIREVQFRWNGHLPFMIRFVKSQSLTTFTPARISWFVDQYRVKDLEDLCNNESDMSFKWFY